MASEFTQQLFDRDLSLKEFVLLCARAMTPLILLRDEPLESPIPEQFEPRFYHREALAKSQAQLAHLTSLGEGAFAEAWAEIDIKETIKNLFDAQTNTSTGTMAPKFTAILAEVKEWQPLTPDHQPLKNFVIDQLESSLKVDGVETDYYGDKVQLLNKVEPLAHFATTVEKSKKEVAYHQREWDEEVRRTKWRNEWLKILRDSLPA